MKWSRRHSWMLAAIWLCTMAFIVIVLVVLPDPPTLETEIRLPSVLLDYLFGAFAVAVAVGVASIAWCVWLVRETDREILDRLNRLESDRSDRVEPAQTAAQSSKQR
jgi:hypothetical protein